MRRFRRLATLGANDCRLLWRAIALLLLARGALRLLPLRTVHRLAERPVRGAAPAEPAPAVIEQVAWAVGAAGRCVPGSRCLPRALVAMTLLRSWGLPARLRLGLARDGRRLLGHAWVETGGRSVGGSGALEEYVPLSMPGRGAR